MRTIILLALFSLAVISCMLPRANPFDPEGTISLTGNAWTQSSDGLFSARAYHGSVYFNNALWVVCGSGAKDAWKFNGTNWSRASALGDVVANPRAGISLLSFSNNLWCIAGGNTNEVKYSDDAFYWASAVGSSFPVRSNQAGVVYNGKMWIIAGLCGLNRSNDVWYSSDGRYWTKATYTAGFSARHGHAVVNFLGKMWLIGGNDATGYTNDVWSSGDGITWTRATAAATFTPRAHHAVMIAKNKIFLVGGQLGAGSYTNDVWSSTDGATWTLVKANAGFSARMMHTLTYLANKMWVVGGYDGAAKNDVWYSE